MVLKVNASVPIYPHVEVSKNALDSPRKIAALFRKHLSEFSFLMRGTSILFSWGRILPVGKELQSLSSMLSAHIAAVRSLFAVPRFIFNQLDLYDASIDLFKTIRAGSEINSFKTLSKVKTVFVKIVYSLNSTISVALLLNRYSIIDFRKISDKLHGALLCSQRVLFLASSSITWVESVWALGKQIGIDVSTKERKGVSPKLVQCIIRVGGSSAGLIASVLRTALLFTEVSFGPMSPLSLASLSRSGTRWLESIWGLKEQVKTDLSIKERKGISPKLTQCIVKVGGSSTGLVASALRTALPFFRLSLGPMTPLILLSLSSISFLSDLVTKMLTQSHLIYEDEGQVLSRNFAHLPT